MRAPPASAIRIRGSRPSLPTAGPPSRLRSAARAAPCETCRASDAPLRRPVAGRRGSAADGSGGGRTAARRSAFPVVEPHARSSTAPCPGAPPRATDFRSRELRRAKPVHLRTTCSVPSNEFDARMVRQREGGSPPWAVVTAGAGDSASPRMRLVFGRTPFRFPLAALHSPFMLAALPPPPRRKYPAATAQTPAHATTTAGS